jgi:hypothetical protein
VGRRKKLIEKMRRTPGSIRFAEVEALLRHQGFLLFFSTHVEAIAPITIPAAGC